MDPVPTLKPQLVSATWVGGRRWDLNFASGETVALPEGEAAAARALERFAKLDKSTGLLGRGILRYDLRIPGKMVARLPRAPGEPIAPEPKPSRHRRRLQRRPSPSPRPSRQASRARHGRGRRQ